jgi:hypothetical protein
LISECTLEEIVNTTSRLAFNQSEIRLLVDVTKKRHKQGHDLQLGDGLHMTGVPDFLAAAENGLCFLHSAKQLETRFLFVKCNAGRGLLGGQKAIFNSYIQDLREEKWAVGAAFKVWGFAATSVGNLYRANL